MLNSQSSSWLCVKVSVLRPLLNLIYINDLSDNRKLFANDTSLLSIVRNKHESTPDINNDLTNI